MTLRNRHSRLNDHDGLLDISDVEFNGASLLDFLSDVADSFASTSSREIVIRAVIRRTMAWQLIDGSIRMDAIIEMAVVTPLSYPGRLTLSSVITKTVSGSRTIDAVTSQTQAGDFTADAVIV